jgi:hypothetical protein
MRAGNPNGIEVVASPTGLEPVLCAYPKCAVWKSARETTRTWVVPGHGAALDIALILEPVAGFGSLRIAPSAMGAAVRAPAPTSVLLRKRLREIGSAKG